MNRPTREPEDALDFETLDVVAQLRKRARDDREHAKHLRVASRQPDRPRADRADLTRRAKKLHRLSIVLFRASDLLVEDYNTRGVVRA